VISGGDGRSFRNNSSASSGRRTPAELSILPTCGTKFFQYTGEWKKLYSEDLSAEQKKKIIDSFHQALDTLGYKPEKVWVR